MSPFEALKTADIVFGLMATIFAAGSGFIYWLHSRLKATVDDSTKQIGVAQSATTGKLDHLERDLRELTGNVGRMDMRMTSMERTVALLPSRDDIHALIVAMTKVQGRMDQLDERLRPIAVTTERMTEWMLERGR